MLHKIGAVIMISIILVSCSSNVSPLPAATATVRPTILPTSTSTLTPAPTPSPTRTPTLVPTSIGGASGKLIFAYYKHICGQENGVCGYEDAFPGLQGKVNIFVSNWDGTELTPITKDGFNNGSALIQSISPDGRKLLVLSDSSNGLELYLVNLDDSDIKPQVVARNLFPMDFDSVRAAWANNSSIVYIGRFGGDIALWRIDLDGSNRIRLSKRIEPRGILAVNPQLGVIWRGDTYDSIQISSLDGTRESTVNVKTVGQFAVNHYSSDGKWIFWQLIHATAENPTDPNQSLYVHELSTNVENPRKIADLPNRYWTIRFSADGKTAVFLPTYGSKLNDPNQPDSFKNLPIYVLSLETFMLKQLFVPDYEQLDIYSNPALLSTALSPDGKLIVVDPILNRHRTFRIYNLETSSSSEEFAKNVFPAAVTSLYWLP